MSKVDTEGLSYEIVESILKELANRKGCNIEQVVGYDEDIMDEIRFDLRQVVFAAIDPLVN